MGMQLPGEAARGEPQCGRGSPGVGDSPEGILKQPGKPSLKPKKTKAKRISLKRTHGARPTLQ
jgi:hypothetical protein